jgi:purine nucleosidase
MHLPASSRPIPLRWQLGINANICLRLAGMGPGVKVYLGDGKPVAEVEITEASHAGVDVHGLDSLGEARPPTEPSDLKFGQLSAKDFIYKRCSELPGQVTLVTLGPLTNVASCLREHPDLPSLVKRIVIMGGAVLEKRGNRTPSSEANFADDPLAASEVLCAGFQDLVLAPLDVTHQLDLLALRTALGETDGELAAFCHDISHFYCSAYFKLGHSGVPVHDPVSACAYLTVVFVQACHPLGRTLAAAAPFLLIMALLASQPDVQQVPIAYMLKPSLFQWRDVRVDVETEGRITSGMSVADWTGQTGPRSTHVMPVSLTCRNQQPKLPE